LQEFKWRLERHGIGERELGRRKDPRNGAMVEEN